MKCLIFVALVAVACAAPPEERRLNNGERKGEEKKGDEKAHGLVWPLPDPQSEGDLMLHGSISFDRVRALHKQKLDDDVDKMILTHGRVFLRRVQKFLDDTNDFKIIPILCRDSRNLNSSVGRWKIEIPKPAQPEQKEDQKENVQRDAPIPKDKADNSSHPNATENENVTTTIAPASSSQASSLAPSSEKPTSERPSSEKPSSEKPSSEKPSSEKPSSEKPSSEKPLQQSTTAKPPVEPVQDTYETRRRDFYRQVGANFARLLLREYRKEQLIQEETDYLAHWISDEAVHYGTMAIFCNEGENVKEIKKQLVAYLEEKQQ